MKIKSGTGTDMIRYACGMAVALLVLVDTPSGWSQQYVYSPTSVGAEGKSQGTDGILVQEVSVRKGDSLYKISRKFSGHGSYYPQILLFNDIKNPDKIYPGNVFKIPVPRNSASELGDTAPAKNVRAEMPAGEGGAPGSAAAASVPSLPAVAPAPAAVPSVIPEPKKVDVGRESKKRVAKEKVAAPVKKQVIADKQHVAADANGQKLFEKGVKAYRQDDCKTALELFDRFLTENQTSPLAADASLYKAECYLKLSTQN